MSIARPPRLATASVLLALLILGGSPARGSTRYDHTLRFRVLTTPHFRIYFHDGEDELARRLAAVAERVHDTLTARLATAPSGRTHVILVDQADVPNGWASPLPYNTIEITAAAPTSGDIIGHTDDWLTMVFTHEYTHILHLDRSESWAAGLRRVFGRAPFLMPNLFVPAWQIEGIATFEESARAGAGRLNAGDFAAIVGRARAAGAFKPIDRVNGGLVDWPWGHAPYAYGGFFHKYLADRFGDARLAELAKRTAGRVPYLSSGAFKSVFGRSLGQLWREFAEDPGDSSTRSEGWPAARRLTRHGFIVSGPRYIRGGPVGHGDAAGATGTRIVYSARDPHRFPAILSIDPTSTAPPRPIATRFLRERLGVGERAIYFDQIEHARNVALHSDLYELDRSTGAVRRITRGARALDPDLSPDGRTLACVVLEPGRRDLALLSLGAMRPTPLVSEPETQFAAPRWSPGGTRLAVERRRLHGPSELALVDVRTGAVQSLAPLSTARHITPAWTPDGKTLLFASDRGGRPFNLYALDLEMPEVLYQVTDLPGGAHSPDVSADGSTIVFVGYTTDGYDLFTIPLNRATWRAVTDPGGPAAPVRSTTVDPALPGPLDARAYSPFSTLLPRFWLPVVQSDDDRIEAGLGTAGVDALGRHAYAIGATWKITGTDPDVPGAPGRGRADWSAYYAYDRWRPTLYATASDETSAVREISAQGAREAVLREEQHGAGVYVPLRRIRHTHAWLGALNYERDTLVRANGPDHRNRTALRLGYSFDAARSFGYSISDEEGWSGGVTGERVRKALGADGDADAVTADLRGYFRLGGRHNVLAVRAAAGGSWGDGAVRRRFALGGSDPNLALLDFGDEAVSLLRGFEEDAFAGRRVALINLDYRWPLLRIQRGHGTWPFFARTLHAAVFADAGHAWDRGFGLGDVKTAVGAELGLDLVAGYFVPLTATAGGAWGRDGARAVPDGWRAYVRLGRAF